MKLIKWLLLLAVCVITLGYTVILAASEKSSPIKATGDRVWGETEKKIAFIEGNVKVVQDVTTINAQKAEIYLDQKQAYFKDGVKLIHPDATVESLSLDYDMKKEIGLFRDRVVMNRTAVNVSNKNNKEPFKLSTTELYFENKTKNFEARGEARLEHKDFTGTADVIQYDDAKQELIFLGKAYLKKKSGEEVRGDLVKIFLEEKNFIVEKNVDISIELED